MPAIHPTARRARSAFTLVELAIVMALIAFLAALSAPSMTRYFEGNRLRTSGQYVQEAFAYARGQALRTGNLHLVFVGTDAGGTPLQDAGGNPVDVLVVDDGRPGDPTQNCTIQAGEELLSFVFETGVALGVSQATSNAPGDGGAGSRSSGSTFVDANSAAASWVLFRPEGAPLAFSSDCTMGAIGTGGGGIYLKNDAGDFAIVLSPLGTTSSHSWKGAGGSWSG